MSGKYSLLIGLMLLVAGCVSAPSRIPAASEPVSDYEKSLLCRALEAKYRTVMKGETSRAKKIACLKEATFEKHRAEYVIRTPTVDGLFSCDGMIPEGSEAEVDCLRYVISK